MEFKRPRISFCIWLAAILVLGRILLFTPIKPTGEDAREAYDICMGLEKRFVFLQTQPSQDERVVYAKPLIRRSKIIVYGITDSERQSEIVAYLKAVKKREGRKPITLDFYEKRLHNSKEERLLKEVRIN